MTMDGSPDVKAASVTPYRLPVARLPVDWPTATQLSGIADLHHPAFGQLKLSHDDSGKPVDMQEEIRLTLDGHEVVLSLQRPLLAPLLRRAGLTSDRDALRADPGLAALVLEHILTDALEVAENRLGRSIRVMAVTSSRTAQARRTPTLALRAVGSPWGGVVRIDAHAATDAAAALLQSVLTHIAAKPDAAAVDVVIAAQLISAGHRLSVGDLGALCPGDGLLLDPLWSPDTDLALLLAGRAVAPVTRSGTHLTLGEAPRPLSRPEETVMTFADPGESFVLDELPVTVVIELDRIELPLANLAGLQAGSVIPCNRPLPDSVRVLVNGRIFATAELVQVGGRFGLRITALANHKA